jgi:glycyl-tRNA synthetase
VIEPSFGLGRIIYCMLEHCFYTRAGSEDKHVFRRAFTLL